MTELKNIDLTQPLIIALSKQIPIGFIMSFLLAQNLPYVAL